MYTAIFWGQVFKLKETWTCLDPIKERPGLPTSCQMFCQILAWFPNSWSWLFKHSPSQTTYKHWASRSRSLKWNPPSLPHARQGQMLSSQILLSSCWLPCTAEGKCKPAHWQWLAPASCIDCSNLRAIYLYWRKFSLGKGVSLALSNMAELRTCVSFWFIYQTFSFHFGAATWHKSPSPPSTVSANKFTETWSPMNT